MSGDTYVNIQICT